MSWPVQIALFGAGLGCLSLGADSLVRGAVALARSFGVSPLVIGLTLVAFGTSAPELSLDLTAALEGSTDLAFGDLVGSNIANVGLVLGAAAATRALRIEMRLLRFEVPAMVVTSFAVWALAADGEIGRVDGLLLLVALGGYLAFSYRAARREPLLVRRELERLSADGDGRVRNALLVAAGLAALVTGAQLMVYAAVAMARALGVSELVIGLTIVAVGTSLPELATGVVAARRGDADIAVGNVVGSNLFNLLGVMGLVAAVRPLPVMPRSLAFDVPAMIVLAIAVVPIMFSGGRISRREGYLLLGAYAALLAGIGWTALR